MESNRKRVGKKDTKVKNSHPRNRELLAIALPLGQDQSYIFNVLSVTSSVRNRICMLQTCPWLLSVMGSKSGSSSKSLINHKRGKRMVEFLLGKKGESRC